MSTSLYFYDLETSGFNPREQRIMQFAGQRTDLQLKPIGEPHNYLIKMTEDILPDPDAVLLTGITPQMTIAEGITEAEFLKIFTEEISVPGTIFTGFNSIRFDDEFMRFLHYRNFYDAYEWHWADDRSRWDLLDVVRMTRALRPQGIKWPFAIDGRPANQLGLLTAINKLEHANAHNALSDVRATVELAQLLLAKQPKLFTFLLNNRDKKVVAKLVNGGRPFAYTSGKYDTEHEKTTVVTTLFESPRKNGAVVYDLRHSPAPFLKMKADELAENWKHYCKERPCTHQRLPVKTLQYNRCPAVAPLGVFDADCQKRLDLPMTTIEKNMKALQGQSKFILQLKEAVDMMDKKYQAQQLTDKIDADGRLYDGFVADEDKSVMVKVRNALPEELSQKDITFSDDRMTSLLPLYKARNYPKYLDAEESELWHRFCERSLLGGKENSRGARFFERLGQLAEQEKISEQKQYLLEELQLYGQSVLPTAE